MQENVRIGSDRTSTQALAKVGKRCQFEKKLNLSQAQGYIGYLNKGPVSLIELWTQCRTNCGSWAPSSLGGRRADGNESQRSNLSKVSLRCWGDAVLDPVNTPGLGDLSVGLQPQKLDFLSKIELNHLIVDETLDMVYLEAVNSIFQLSAGEVLG